MSLNQRALSRFVLSLLSLPLNRRSKGRTTLPQRTLSPLRPSRHLRRIIVEIVSLDASTGSVMICEAVVVHLLEVLIVFELVALAAAEVEEEGETEDCDENGATN